MYLYIDESYDKQRFVMGAIKTSTERDACYPVTLTRNWIRRVNKDRKAKGKIIINEFKDNVIHGLYPEVKDYILCAISNMPIEIYAVVYPMDQSPEVIYKHAAIELIKQCLPPKRELIRVIFDQYKDEVYRRSLYAQINEQYGNIISELTHRRSDNTGGIQVSDIVTGTIRRYLAGDDVDRYKKISLLVKTIRETTIGATCVASLVGPGVPCITPLSSDLLGTGNSTSE